MVHSSQHFTYIRTWVGKAHLTVLLVRARAHADGGGAPPIHHASQLPSRRSLHSKAPAARTPPRPVLRLAPLRPLAAPGTLASLEPVVILPWARGLVGTCRQAVKRSLVSPPFGKNTGIPLGGDRGSLPRPSYEPQGLRARRCVRQHAREEVTQRLAGVQLQQLPTGGLGTRSVN